MPHNLDRDDVDLAALTDEVSTRLGRPVALSARAPGQTDDDGKPLPGILVIIDADSGEELDVDAAVVAATVREHKRPPTAEERRQQGIAAAEEKARTGDTAGALADLLAMLRGDSVPPPSPPPQPPPASQPQPSPRP
jgi:hypothetical protein